MAPTIKASPLSGSISRQKKAPKTLLVTLKLSSTSLAAFAPVAVIKAEPEPKAEAKTASSTTSNTLAATTPSPGENASESNSNTPAPSGTEGSSAMPPPTEGVKKTGKGIKRTSAVADGLLKPRGKPGPKKKTKLEDGSIDPNSRTAGPFAAPHKLGPKANQGAINAGLRALDRSGKPCRKWQKGSFKIKSFTGTVWEIPRWQAPPKVTINGNGGSDGSASGSSKENKENSHLESEKSNTTDVDVDLKSSASINDAKSSASIPASSPAPVISAAA